MRNLSIVDGHSVYQREEIVNAVCCSQRENSSQIRCFSSVTIKAITLQIQSSFNAAGKETLLTGKYQGNCSVCVQLHSLAQVSW